MTPIPELPVMFGLAITIIAVFGSIAPAYATNIHDVPIGMGVKLTNMQELQVLDREYDYAYHLTFENIGEFDLTIVFDYIGYYTYMPTVYPLAPLTIGSFCDDRLEIRPNGTGTMIICYTFHKDDHVPGFKTYVHDDQLHRGVSDSIEFGANNPSGRYSSTCNEYFGEFCLSIGEAIEFVPGLVPSLRATITDGFGGFTELDGASGVDVVEMSGRVYAVVTAWEDDGMQIIDITDPTKPVLTAAITDEVDGFTELDGAVGVDIIEISGRVYAVVAAKDDDGIQIVDITDPTAPVPTATASDGRNGFIVLDGAFGVDTVKISDRVYAMVTAWQGDGVQMLDVTDPARPIPASAAVDDWGGFTELDGATGIDIVEISGRVYAVVAAWKDDGVQIIDVTDPTTLVPIAAIVNESGVSVELRGAFGVATTEISGRVYAVVTAKDDDGVQIMDITDPARPILTSAIVDDWDGFTELDGATGIDIVEISGRVYAIVTAEDDHGVQIVDITDPDTPIPVTSFSDWYDTSANSYGLFGVATTMILDRVHMIVTAWLDDRVQIIGMHSHLDQLTPSTNTQPRDPTTPHTDYPPNHPAVNFFATGARYDRVSGVLDIAFTQDIGEVDLWYVRMSGGGTSSLLVGGHIVYEGNTVSITLSDKDVENFEDADSLRLIFNTNAVMRSDTMFMLPQTLVVEIIR